MNNTDTQPYSSLDIASIRSAAHVTWSLTALVGIPANVFVLASIIAFRDMRTISNIYIFNLAIADLLFLSGMPIGIFGYKIDGGWILGLAMCKLFISGTAVSQFSSAVFIAILSFDRYLAVCRPISSSSWRAINSAIFLSLSAWVMVILEMTPLLLFVKLLTVNTGTNETQRACMLFVGNTTVLDFSKHIPSEQLNEVEKSMLVSRRLFLTYTFAFSYLIPLIAVWYFYVKIITKMCKRRKQMYIKRTTTKRKTTKVTIMGLAIVISYTLCYLPFWINQWAIEFNLLKNHTFVLIIFTHIAYSLQYINSAVNPFLYVFFSDSFKKNISKLLKTAKPSKSTSKNKMKNFNNNHSDTSKMLQLNDSHLQGSSTLSTELTTSFTPRSS